MSFSLKGMVALRVRARLLWRRYALPAGVSDAFTVQDDACESCSERMAGAQVGVVGGRPAGHAVLAGTQ